MVMGRLQCLVLVASVQSSKVRRVGDGGFRRASYVSKARSESLYF
jgi:hypothetical protein